MTTTGDDTLAVAFLAQGEQTATTTAQKLAAFIGEARQSLDFATYDFRLTGASLTTVAAALRERANVGVRIRIAYDADKPEQLMTAQGVDPAPPGSGAVVQSLGYPFRRIGGMKLMHHKYIVRDAPAANDVNMSATAAVWTGSTNFTDDAWTVQENNIVTVSSAPLAAWYARDFDDLWQVGDIGNSGAFDTQPVSFRYAGSGGTARVWFAPGRGAEIDAVVAERVAAARRRVHIGSMLLNSGTLINALTAHLDRGIVDVRGVFDRTQMAGVLLQWETVPHNVWKIAAVRDIVARARLSGKNSTPYRPTSIHDFMHDKVLVVDDTVITGSFNFSRSAQFNAENLLILDHPALAETYSRTIAHITAKYAQTTGVI